MSLSQKSEFEKTSTEGPEWKFLWRLFWHVLDIWKRR